MHTHTLTMRVKGSERGSCISIQVQSISTANKFCYDLFFCVGYQILVDIRVSFLLVTVSDTVYESRTRFTRKLATGASCKLQVLTWVQLYLRERERAESFCFW